MTPSLPLLNVTSGPQAAGNAARAANPADSFTADVPFNQVLNSQVSQRNQDNAAQDKPHTPEPEAAKPSQPAPAASQAHDAASTAKADGKDKDDDKEAEDDSDDTTTEASAQLLALVANLEQHAVKPVAAGKQDKGEQPDADLLAQAKRGTGKLMLPGDAREQVAADDGKNAKTGFAAALQGKADTKQEAAPADLSRQAAIDAAQDGKSKGDAKPALEPAAAKAEPKEDPSALAARVLAAKAGSDSASLKQQQAAPATPAPVTLPAMQQAMAAAQPQAVFGALYSDKINPNVGSAGWDQAVGQKMTWMVAGGIQSASLSLNPPDLGPMQVVLSVHNQQADATFITAQPEVRQALEAAMPKLREMMDQAGIQLGQATVNTGTPNQQQAGNQSGRSASGTPGRTADGDNPAVTGAGSATVAQAGLGLVDTFA